LWPTFDPHDNWFGDVLSRRYELEIVTSKPDLLLYSVYGSDHLRFTCTRLLVSFENRGWSFAKCDWAATSDHIRSPRHHRLPLWATLLPEPFVQPTIDAAAVLDSKTGFAATVVSNGTGETRERVHHLLDAYRPVSSGGRHRNNVGGPVSDKIEFFRRHKFALAFENSSYPGYSTEKLLHALQADTVPIYWGDPLIATDFNSRRFVNAHEFASEAALIDRVIELDGDDDAFRRVLAEPWFPSGVTPACADMEAFLDWVDHAASSTRTPVAQRTRRPNTIARSLIDRHRTRSRYLGRVR
jgi:hypothetical protein